MANEPKTSMCITIDKDLLSRFRQYCKSNGMKMSTKINNLIIEAINN